MIEESLDRVGWVQNIIVNKRTGHVIDGHARVALALRHEQKVQVVYVDVSEEEEKLLLSTLDPVAGLAVTDEAQLSALLKEFDVSGMPTTHDFLAGLGANGERTDDAAPKIDEAAELQRKWKTKTGQLWCLGKHRLLCGDSTNEKDVDLLLDSQLNAIVTDPPYGIDLNTDWSGIRGTGPSLGFKKNIKGKSYAPVYGDGVPFDPTWIFKLWARQAKEIFLFGANYYIEKIPKYLEGSWLVWDKRKESQADGFGSEFEMIWSKNKHKQRILRHEWFGFLRAGEHGQKRTHPTQKPVALMQDIIKQWCHDDPIGDPYGGVGATTLACENLGRYCYSMEIDPGYVAVTLQRWFDATGEKPKQRSN